jgi:hypothetical protein
MAQPDHPTFRRNAADPNLQKPGEKKDTILQSENGV